MANNLVIVTGYKEIDAKLRSFPAKVQRKYLRTATRNAAKKCLAEARRNTPVDSGAMRDSLKVRAVKSKRKSVLRRRGLEAEIGHSVVIDRDVLFDLYQARHGGDLPSPRSGDNEPHFYPASVELGDENKEGERPLRKALYDNKAKYMAEFRAQMLAALASAKTA